MAAGKGERMFHLTKNNPKALVRVNKKPLILYTLEQVIKTSGQIFITIGHKGDKVADFVSSKGEFRFINTNLKGNAWWIQHSCLKTVNEPVLVFACDIITMIDIDFIYHNYKKAGFPVCMLISITPVDGVDADFIFGKNGQVTSLSRTEKSVRCSSGIQIINPCRINRLLNIVPEDFNELWTVLIEKKLLHYSDTYPHCWYSINTPEQLEIAKKILYLKSASKKFCRFRKEITVFSG